MSSFILKQEPQGVRVIDDMNPGHSLFAIAEFSSKKETRRQGHEREQSPFSGKDHSIPENNAAYAKLLHGSGGILPGDRKLGEKVAGGSCGFICNFGAPQSVTVDAGRLEENARATVSLLECGDERASGKDTGIHEFLSLTFCPRPMFQSMACQVHNSIHLVDNLSPSMCRLAIPLNFMRLFGGAAGQYDDFMPIVR
jgi:hypothetical protein